jgi:hypothetical protein
MMITASYMMSRLQLRKEFRDDEVALGAIDAPEAISTGSHRTVKLTRHEHSVPSCMLRDEYCWN